MSNVSPTELPFHRPPDPWARAAGFDRVHPAVTDSVIVVLLAAASGSWMALHGDGSATAWLCCAGLLLPLVVRRRWPTPVFAVIAAVALVQWTVGRPLLADVALLVAVFTVVTERPRREAVGAWLILEVGVVMASLRWHFSGSWVRSLVGLSGLAAAAVLAGVAYRARRAHLDELTERAARLELERDQQAQIAAAAERTRIAREMHDVIAHSLAVMITLAEGSAAKIDRDPERAGAAIDSLIDVGRQALGETRRLLGVLRDAHGEPELAPQPGLAQIEDLLAKVRATGIGATLRVVGERFAVPPSAEMTVYRIVQEAATNTLKHAGTATQVQVTLSFERPLLRVEVLDDGAGMSEVEAVAGHGIAGMRERLALYGGHLDVGPDDGGGWAVRATLRTPASPAGPAAQAVPAGRPA